MPAPGHGGAGGGAILTAYVPNAGGAQSNGIERRAAHHGEAQAAGGGRRQAGASGLPRSAAVVAGAAYGGAIGAVGAVGALPDAGGTGVRGRMHGRYTDAAREAGTGLGGYAPVELQGELVFFYVEARWPEHILTALQENKTSMPAGELFTMVVTIVAVVEALDSVAHVVGFTDSDETRAAVTSGASPAPQLNHMVMWLQREAPSTQFLAIHQPGKRNDAADGISRSRRREVLEEVREVGWRTRRLPLPRGSWELADQLLSLPPAVPA